LPPDAGRRINGCLAAVASFAACLLVGAAVIAALAWIRV